MSRPKTGQPRSDRSGSRQWGLRLAQLGQTIIRPVYELRRLWRRRRTRSAGRRGARWPGRWRVTVNRYLAYAGGLLLLLWLLRAIVVVFVLRKAWSFPVTFNPDVFCKETAPSCGALTGIGVSWLSLAAATALFLIWRMRRVVNRYRRRAKNHPADLVPTAASSLVGDVVGRNDLCRVIVEDLRNSEDRRPHILLGGVGTGKTAVLVLLTRLLAKGGATPVPIRLRDAQDSLDFGELARMKFQSEVNSTLLSQSEGDRIWRYLLKNDRIVVLADGLEEALTGTDTGKDRDNIIRLAIQRARAAKLPLVIASRPHDPLRGSDAAVLDLEPLSRLAALDYLGENDLGDDRQRLNWIVETADVAEAPWFLQITRDLHRQDLLRHLTKGVKAQGVNTRSLDRSALRLNLLDTWLSALLDGRLCGHVPLTRDDRVATVAFVSALAATGLQSDSLVVRYDEVVKADGTGREEFLNKELNDRVQKSLGTFRHRPLRVRLAATWASRLGLLEVSDDAVRFNHSILQAYLGSLVLDSVVGTDAYLQPALCQAGRPAREFLIALVFLSRRQEQVEVGSSGLTSPNPLPGFSRPNAWTMRGLVKSLVDEAARRKDNKSLDMFAAAMEIDSVNALSIHTRIAARIFEVWPEIFAPDQRTLDEAKLGLVHRYGDALRQLQRRKDQQWRKGIAAQGVLGVPRPAYTVLFRLGCLEESSYAVRHAIAQELGSGGHGAFRALHSELEIGEGGTPGVGYTNEASWRRVVMRAWLSPLLLGSVDEKEPREAAEKNLRRWIEHVGVADPHQQRAPLPPSVELALAQGFAYAANRRRRHPHMNSGSRSFLVEQAGELLERSGFWAAQLTLIHALCLWSLRDDPEGGIAEEPRERPHPNTAPIRVNGWLESAGTQRERTQQRNDGHPDRTLHPFVKQAAKLAVRALDTREPERFLWIDVFGVTSKIGSRAASPTGTRQHSLWIPPSVGWSALDSRAQQLVADVLLLINLADRGDEAEVRERRLRRANRPDLPPCLQRDRRPLAPERAVSTVDAAAPGSNCVGGCVFALCPYPPKSGQSYRTEMSDAFCRRQQTLLSARSRLRPRPAPWQRQFPGHLRRFWAAMALRARR